MAFLHKMVILGPDVSMSFSNPFELILLNSYPCTEDIFVFPSATCKIKCFWNPTNNLCKFIHTTVEEITAKYSNLN